MLETYFGTSIIINPLMKMLSLLLIKEQLRILSSKQEDGGDGSFPSQVRKVGQIQP